MSERRESVEQLNVVLMVVSCLAAFAAPFQLFLFVYAVLGPLHYLTEISWLHDRDYFAPRRPARRWWLALVGVAMAVLMYGYVSNDLLQRPVSPAFEIGLTYLVFFTAPLLLWVRHPVNAGVLVIMVGAGLLLFSSARVYALLAYFIITIVHVLIFTAAFVLQGAIKSRSKWALVSLGVFAACIASALVIDVRPFVVASAEVRRVYSFFESLNAQLMALFGSAGAGVYDSPGGIAVMRLIAFAYTYHYLNWFSKTSIIKWHEVPKRRLVAIVAAWVGSVAVYVYDYTLGLSLLYMVSLLHVLLEFPLNHRSFAGIAEGLWDIARGRARGRVPMPATTESLPPPAPSRSRGSRSLARAR
ncbi:MAG: hypothetical protein M3P06_20720 [Acidobacteriota bacterium]|nr:hypothetical protein [Acidobacteriota bacterium]